MNLSQQIIATKGRSTGFDYLRILLAVAVVAVHTIPVCYGWAAMDGVWQGPWGPFAFFIIPSFFALSGFLVAGSLERVNNIPVFLTLRATRIFPALCCEVLISALLLGPLLTDLPLSDYFTDRSFWSYMLNVFGSIHYDLAGVFLNNPVTTVNNQLWTIPYELKCYILLTVLAIAAVTKNPRLLGRLAILLNIAAFFWIWHQGLLSHWDKPTGSMLLVSFLWGVHLYLYREKVPYNKWLCLGAAIFSYIALFWSTGTAYLAPLPIAYVTIYLGLQSPPKTKLIIAGDYSYGIYLYGWPIQQTVAYLFPEYRFWYVNLVVSLVVSCFFAWLSWTFVESKILARKGYATRFVDATCTRIGELRWKQIGLVLKTRRNDNIQTKPATDR
jgi:peptidoglycan/LPS O-acetylase OafA/YrhL